MLTRNFDHRARPINPPVVHHCATRYLRATGFQKVMRKVLKLGAENNKRRKPAGSCAPIIATESLSRLAFVPYDVNLTVK